MFYKKKKALDKSSYLFLILVINSFALSASNALKISLCIFIDLGGKNTYAETDGPCPPVRGRLSYDR